VPEKFDLMGEGCNMADDFFTSFAAHAHTMNEMELDPQRELELRRRNSPEEARKLVEMVLDKLEKDILKSGYSLEDVKLLILYLSYRGETGEKDGLICKSILEAIEERFKKNEATQLRIIGHTTGGELENEDLVLKEISGVGYNGLSLLALATNLPIGVGRTWGLRTPKEAGDQGREMARDAWVDFSQQAASKEHLHMGKTMLVLTQGSKVDTPGYEHFLAEGIANFMGSTREARIMNVIGGSSGDGLAAQYFHQFYGRLKEHLQPKILDGEAVCALIPNLCETSIGLDINAIARIGKEHTFHFDKDKEPHFKYVKRIDREKPGVVMAEAISENEVKMAKEKGLPIPDKKAIQVKIQEAIQLSREQKRLLIFDPICLRYAFAFPFGNYTCAATMRMVEDDVELMFPIRSFTPEMTGHIWTGDPAKVQKGGRQVFDMLRADQGFNKTDATMLICCINRRLVELMAGCRSGTEAEILKEGLASSQVMGFLAYGEMSFTNLMQEPYTYGFTSWGITFHSKETCKQETILEPQSVGISESALGRVATGSPHLDRLLLGGIPENYAVTLTAPSGEERDALIRGFVEKGAKQNEITFFLTTNPGTTKSLAQSEVNFHLFICNPQADKIVKDQSNVVKLKGVENLTDISIALSLATRRLDPSQKGPRRICIDLLSDVLLQHHAVQTRKWLTSLIAELKSNGFTALAVIDPRMHPSEELYAITGLFDGEISISEKETEKSLERYLRIKKMSNQQYLKDEILLTKEARQNRK
jgi:KaiC/GvpD/RAD55 family RecA-like ATPase